jgi:hypothetical protein
MGFIGLAIVVAVFVALFLWDRNARRHGHRLRNAGEMRRAERDVRRNVRLGRQTFHNPVDQDWSKPDERRYRK